MRILRPDDERAAAEFPGQAPDVQTDLKLAQVDAVQFDLLGRDRQVLILAAAADPVKLLLELDQFAIEITERRYRGQGSLNTPLGLGDVVGKIPQGASGLIGHAACGCRPVASNGLFLGGPGPGNPFQAVYNRIRLPGDLGQPTGLHQLKLLANHAGYTRKSRRWRIDFHGDPFRVRGLEKRRDT